MQCFSFCFSQCKGSVVKFDFKEIDDMIVLVNEQINLNVMFFFFVLMVVGRSFGIYISNVQCVFNFFDVFKVNIFKGIIILVFKCCCLIQLVLCFFFVEVFLLYKLQIKQGIFICEVIQLIFFGFFKWLVSGDKV